MYGPYLKYFIFSFLLVTVSAGAAMNEINPVKLGKRISGNVTRGTYANEINDPAH